MGKKKAPVDIVAEGDPKVTMIKKCLIVRKGTQRVHGRVHGEVAFVAFSQYNEPMHFLNKRKEKIDLVHVAEFHLIDEREKVG